MKIKYTTQEGKTLVIEMSKDQENVVIEVSKEVFEGVKEFELTRTNRNRMERRHNRSLECEQAMGRDPELPDQDTDPLEQLAEQERQIEIQERYQSLHRALERLLPRQRELVHRLFFEGVSMVQIAREEGVSVQAIQDRVKKIYERIKKHI